MQASATECRATGLQQVENDVRNAEPLELLEQLDALCDGRRAQRELEQPQRLDDKAVVRVTIDGRVPAEGSRSEPHLRQAHPTTA
jgi:hypothetical protein